MKVFDLEQAIQDWKKGLWKHQGLEPGHIEELESHLRDRIDDYLDQGFPSEAAFDEAKKRSMPAPEILAKDFFYARNGGSKTPPWEKNTNLFCRMPMNIRMAMRSMRKQMTYSIINISGLATGLATCLLLTLYISNEFSYDHFYKDSDRIYRMAVGQSGQSTSAQVGKLAKLDFPEIEETTRVQELGDKTFKLDDTIFRESGGYGVDSTFNNMFPVNFIEGNPAQAWREPNTVVLTESLARKYFRQQPAYGKLIELDGLITKVTGVVNDPPSNTHLQYKYLLSFAHTSDVTHGNWIEKWYATYAKLVPGTDPQQLEKKFPEFRKKYAGKDIINWMGYDSYDEMVAATGTTPTYTLKPLTDLHLYYPRFSFDSGGSIDNIYTFSLISIFILIIACINFMNLCTAKSATRLKEVGVRKVLGSKRKQLIFQFLTETTMMSLFAMVIALSLAFLSLQGFSNLADRQFTIQNLLAPNILLSFLCLTIIVGLLAGCYPAFYLSAFKPVKALRGELKVRGSNVFLRKGLVVFQFGISIFLIISTLVVFNQLDYVRSKSLGMNAEQVLTIKNASALRGSLGVFKNSMLSNPNIASLSYSFGQPFKPLPGSSLYLVDDKERKTSFTMLRVDEDFWSTYDIRLKDGRLFSPDLDAGWANYIVNEAGEKWIGVESAASTKIGDSGFAANVIGVVRDFHFESLKAEIAPMVIKYSDPVRDSLAGERWGQSYRGLYDHMYTASIRLKGNYTSALEHLEETWVTLVPNEPLDYGFLDETFNSLYESDKRFGILFSVSSGLAIAIASLGLFALASFTLERKLKELAIRKVLGASVTRLVLAMIREFTTLLVLAAILAIPVGYWVMNNWLQSFAYRIHFSPLLLFVPGLIVAILVWLMIGFQSTRVILRNPVNVLRTE
jgi:putative ABC transport system permease protein